MSTPERLREIPGSCATPDELGNAGWTVLHSAAAVYPYKPSPAQQEAFRSFLRGWSQVYACSHCAYHMRRYLERNPPVVTDKLGLNRYICEFHNTVSRNLGKDVYDCDPMNVLRRWHPTFPEMEDQPSIEEQILEEEQKQRLTQLSSRAGDEQKRVAPGRWWREKGTGGETTALGEFAAGWGASGRQKRGEEQQQQQLAQKEVVATPSEVKPPQKRWLLFGFGGGGSDADASHNIISGGSVGAGGSSGGAVADDEADVSAILRRLKACMVYCPEKKETSSA